MEFIDVVKVFAPATISFVFGVAMTPFVTNYLYRNQMWKHRARELASDGKPAPIVHGLHAETETKTPKMGGIIIWASTLLTVLVFWLLAHLDGPLATKLSFLSRNQTWLPLATLLIGAIVGLVDDYFEVKGTLDYFAGGLSLRKRLLLVFVMSLVAAWWFYAKLEVTSILIPFVGPWRIGIMIVPFFSLVMLSTYAGGVIDGVDGLAGGVFAIIFSAYGAIAYTQHQIDLAAFCIVVVGGILAFLWFNIPPARFYMSETGSMALTLTLTVVAFLTQEVLVLPIIAFPLVASAGSSALQLLSKKVRGKQIFRAAPIHHHFQALGWPSYKVTMRYWVISIIFAIVGLIVSLIG